MEQLKKIWPHAAKTNSVKSLVITILIYIVANLVLGLVLGLLGNIPLLGLIAGIVAWVISIYCFVGIVLSVLFFLNILK